ncbi:MAG: Ig-like domain-containing protein, partial [Cyanobacteria bacterium J06641_2]
SLDLFAVYNQAFDASEVAQNFFAGSDDSGDYSPPVPTNTFPVANNDTFSISENTANNQLNVLANDSDSDGDTLAVSIGNLPANGTLNISQNNLFYTPNSDFIGTDTFTYQIDDGNGGTDTATVSVNITEFNDIPVIANDSATTDEDTAVTIDVLANDSDGDGDDLTISSVGSGSNGTTAIINNQIVYTPNSNFNGVDSFSYEINDGNGGSDTATVTVNVAPVNDIPVAQNDSATTTQETGVSINVLGNDSDVDGDNLTVVSVNSGNNGTTAIVDNQIIYTPQANFTGVDSFSYETSDGNEVTTAQVSVTVTESGSNSSDRVSQGLLALYNFNEGSGDTVFDVSGVGTALNLEINNPNTTTWGDGILNLNSPSLIASVQAADKLIDGITTTQEVTLEAWLTPSNRTQDGPARIATLSSNTSNRNFTFGQAGDDYNVRFRTTTTGNNGVEASVSSNGGLLETALTHVIYTREADGDASLYVNNQLVASETIGGNLSNWNENYRFGLGDEFGGGRSWLGSLDLFAVYNQAFDASEVAQNFFAASDDSQSPPNPPNPVNNIPVAADDSITTNEDTQVNIDVLANDSDVDGDNLTVVSADPGNNGTTAIVDNKIIYTPEADFTGVDSFNYQISDGNEVTTAQVTVTVNESSSNPSDRVDEGLLALYNFNEGSGD